MTKVNESKNIQTDMIISIPIQKASKACSIVNHVSKPTDNRCTVLPDFSETEAIS